MCNVFVQRLLKMHKIRPKQLHIVGGILPIKTYNRHTHTYPIGGNIGLIDVKMMILLGLVIILS